LAPGTIGDVETALLPIGDTRKRLFLILSNVSIAVALMLAVVYAMSGWSIPASRSDHGASSSS